MIIAGLQKLSLLDFPGKVAATVFTGGCNLRCPFCHNSELLEAPPALMTAGEFFEFLSGRKGKIDGVCITGGEPCLQPDLCDFMKQIKTAGFAVKLDTNGCFPKHLENALNQNLLDYVALDVKNSAEQYPATTGTERFGIDNLLRSIELLLTSSVPFELRTTVVEPLHTVESFTGICSLLGTLTERTGRKIPEYYLQPFVDRDTVPFAGLKAPNREKLAEYAKILAPVAEKVRIRG